MSHIPKSGTGEIASAADIMVAAASSYALLLEENNRLRKQVSLLTDPTAVHANILRGTLPLTKEAAIHIAGLSADIEEKYEALRKSHGELLEALRRCLECKFEGDKIYLIATAAIAAAEKIIAPVGGDVPAVETAARGARRQPSSNAMNEHNWKMPLTDQSTVEDIFDFSNRVCRRCGLHWTEDNAETECNPSTRNSGDEEAAK